MIPQGSLIDERDKMRRREQQSSQQLFSMMYINRHQDERILDIFCHNCCTVLIANQNRWQMHDKISNKKTSASANVKFTWVINCDKKIRAKRRRKKWSDHDAHRVGSHYIDTKEEARNELTHADPAQPRDPPFCLIAKSIPHRINDFWGKIGGGFFGGQK